jgi:hypothetical protein
MSTLRRYQRSDEIIIVNKVLPNGTKVKVEVVVAPSQTPAVVIRGDSQTLDTADGVPDTKRDHAYIVLSYFCSALAGATLLLVLCLHFVSAQTPTQVVPSLSLPNQWELLAYMTYLQDMSSTGQYVVIAVPTYLWRFVDAFSWATLIPLHGHDSAIGYRFLGKNSGRRLSGTIVLDGLIAFADRVGIGEKQLLQSTVTTFLIGVGFLFVLAVAVVYYVKFVRDDDADAETDREMSDRESHTLAAHTVDIYGRQRSRWPILVVEGTTVAFFAFSLYPIMVMIIFEISSQIRARDTQGGALAIALIALVFACALFIFRTISSVLATRHVGEFRYGYRMVWGSLNSPDVIKYERRIQFVVAWFATQIMTALVVGSVRSEEWQLALLLAIDVAGVVGIVACNPFVDGLFAGIAVSVILVKAINTSLVFSFLSRGDLLASHRRATATAFVMLNAAILILWFLRLVWVAHGVWCSHFHPRRMSATSTATALGSPLRDPGDPDSPHYVPLLSADKSATCEDH